MKQHFVSLWFNTKSTLGYNTYFSGLVTGKEYNGKLVISPEKLFRIAFGIELPSHTTVTIL